MARSKRQLKKLQKKEQQRLLLESGYRKKQVEKLSSKELEKLSNPIIQQKQVEKKRDAYVSFWQKDETKKEQQKILKRASAKKLHREKVYALEKLGIPREYLSEYQTRKIKMQDIKDGKVNRFTHPDLFSHSRLNETQIHFNYRKVYKAENGKAFYFAFLDYTGENELGELMGIASNKTTKELLQAISNLLRTSPSYVRGKSASSGKAATYKYNYTSIDIIKIFHAETRQTSRHYKRVKNEKMKRKRVHTSGSNNAYQVLWNTPKGCNYFEELSVRAMLEIMYVFMDNVTEHERFTFFDEFYYDLVNHLQMSNEEREKLIKVLPNPNIREW